MRDYKVKFTIYYNVKANDEDEAIEKADILFNEELYSNRYGITDIFNKRVIKTRGKKETKEEDENPKSLIQRRLDGRMDK